PSLACARGAERRKALVRNAAPGGPPCGRADPWIARDLRPMTLAGAPRGAPPRHFWRSPLRRSSGPGFRDSILFLPLMTAAGPVAHGAALRSPGGRAGPVQRAPRRAVLLPPGSLPGAARVQAYETCPQGPPLAPSAERPRKTPVSERGDRGYTYFPYKVNKILGQTSHKIVNCAWIGGRL